MAMASATASPVRFMRFMNSLLGSLRPRGLVLARLRLELNGRDKIAAVVAAGQHPGRQQHSDDPANHPRHDLRTLRQLPLHDFPTITKF